jgi:diguanylate cyclase (GGDEF)-like protein
VVDDNPDMLEVYRKILSGDARVPADSLNKLEMSLFGESATDPTEVAPSPCSFSLALVTNGLQARDLAIQARDLNRPYAMAFVDIRMPAGWDGLQTACELWQVDSDMQIVLCTAYADYSWEQMVERLGHPDRFVVLRKPFDVTEVRQLAYAFCERWRLHREQKTSVQTQLDRLSEETRVTKIALDAATQRTQLLLEAINDAVIVLDHGWQVTYISAGAELILDQPDGQLLGKNLWEAMPASIESQTYRVSQEAMKTQVPHSFIEYCARLNTKVAVSVCPHGEELLIFLKNTADSSGDCAESPKASDLDRLTGIPNRLNGLRDLHTAIVCARRHEQSVAAILVDLDQFHEVNEVAGYDSADRILKEIAQRLADHAPSGSFVARMNGDEFLIVVEHPRVNEIVLYAHSLLNVLAEPILVDGNIFRLSASVGAAIYPDDDRDPAELLRKASAAMADAKAAGGAVVRMYDGDASSHRHTKAVLRHEMEQALILGGFELYYQPQVSLRDGRVMGAEALIRWRHPKWGLLAPADFISIAEQSSLISRIDAWVMDRACQQLAEWTRLGRVPSAFVISINLSARQLSDENLLALISEALTRHQVDPQSIEFEITETAMLQSLETAAHSLSAVKKLGVRLALDDFGVGYSNLDYVKRFPIDKLKIDRSFIRNTGKNAQALLLIDAIIQLGKKLNLCVVGRCCTNRPAGRVRTDVYTQQSELCLC